MSQQGSVLVVGVGASRGLGAATARRFAKGGFPVVVAGRNHEKLDVVLKELKAAGAKAEAITGDAASADDAKRFVAAAEALAPLCRRRSQRRRQQSRAVPESQRRQLHAALARACARRLPSGASGDPGSARAWRRLAVLHRCVGEACAAKPISRLSPPQRRPCAISPRASRANTARRTSMWVMLLSTVASKASGSFRVCHS